MMTDVVSMQFVLYNKKGLLQQAKGLLRIYFSLGFNSCKATLLVTNIVETLAEDNSVCAINETDKLILRWVEVTLDHFGLFGDCKTRRNAVLASDCFDLFNAGVC